MSGLLQSAPERELRKFGHECVAELYVRPRVIEATSRDQWGERGSDAVWRIARLEATCLAFELLDMRTTPVTRCRLNAPYMR